MRRSLLVCVRRLTPVALLAFPLTAAAQQPSASAQPQVVTPAAPPAAAPQAPPKVPIFNRANQNLPKWLQVRGEFRERFEGFESLGFIEDRDDSYALTRFRFNIAATANKYLSFQANLQDARVADKTVGPTTAPFRGPFDVRALFADVGTAGERFGTIIGERVGRIIVMLVVAAMGASLGSFTARLSSLPGFGRAAQLFQARCGFSFGAVTSGGVQAVTISATGAVVALTPGAAWATTNAMVGSRGGGSTVPPKGRVWFKNHKALVKALGSAGKDKEWHHIVEQNPTNMARKDIGPQRIHTPDNVVPLDKELHWKINAHYSSIRQSLTNSKTLTIREWLSTQSFEEQRAYGLRVVRTVLAGGTP
jgi:hypothetical protein